MKKDNNYSVPGFLASAVSAGLNKTGTLDLSLIFSQKKAVAAGVFTTNKVKAAPVLLSQERIKKGFLRAVIANTGYANACTGTQGLHDSIQTADMASKELGIDPEETVVASTGVIGAYLPCNLIEKALPNLVKNLSSNGFKSVANSLMTTDSFPKMSYFEGRAQGNPFHLLGIAKGAGMIMPDMATMLSFLLTDINIDFQTLWPIFRSAVECTFNRITVDGETSTNDMVLIMANGVAGNRRLTKPDIKEFERGLTDVMEELAYMIAKDGEGATKVVIIEVNGAASKDDANTAARVVGNSNLVKTTIFGQDPNWGRIMAALGRAGIKMEENKVQIWIDGIKVVDGGLMTSEKEERKAAERMKKEQITITIHLNQGKWKDRIITCDLTYDYIRINAGYRT
ncbi:MAG: bifunctional glutamate N-acetyltransferase/amino-acid acetyltransferase ArgJ [Desulfobacteraceae bacterium]|nr:MAG: bifunctional glutamate N-acetyltransferase/amino-acid acetyltransferase ArgJ [Desulfobacteraceae bacterium]